MRLGFYTGRRKAFSKRIVVSAFQSEPMRQIRAVMRCIASHLLRDFLPYRLNLHDIVQLCRAACLFPEDIIDILEGLFKHSTTLTYVNDLATRFYSDQDQSGSADRPSCL